MGRIFDSHLERLRRKETSKKRELGRATNFDGASSIRINGSMGVSNGNAGTANVWFRWPPANVTFQQILAMGGTGVEIGKDTRTLILLRNSSTTTIYSASSPVIADGKWHNLLVSWRLDGTPVAHFYVDEVLGTTGTLITGTVDYAATNWALGSQPAGTFSFEGGIRSLWFDDTYLDLSVESNRRKFLTADHRPANLGQYGERPLSGTLPKMYIQGGIDTIRKNKGSGLDFNTDIAGSIELSEWPVIRTGV